MYALTDYRDGLDLRREAIWESTDEGQRALNDEKQRMREGMRLQNVRRWLGDLAPRLARPRFLHRQR